MSYVTHQYSRVDFSSSLEVNLSLYYGGVDVILGRNTRGGPHILGRTGMCRSNGSLFYKKSLNMGPVFYDFYQKILKHGSAVLTEPGVFAWRKPRNF